jgi:hypothetical protein
MLKDHRNLTSTLIARLFYKEIVENTSMGVKQTALENIFGTFYDAYDVVVRLLQTLKDRNPGTHVDIQTLISSFLLFSFFHAAGESYNLVSQSRSFKFGILYPDI